MIYKEFNNIDIDNKIGVSSVDSGTKLIAKNAKNIKFKSALDVGTGTGFIPIYLTKLGLKCDGSDLNPLAVKCAEENAKKNKVEINLYISDIFKNITKKYDLIIANLPYGGTSSITLSKYLEIIKSIFPKENKFINSIIHKVSFRFIKKQREKLFNQFLNELNNVLNKNGKVLLLLFDKEISLVNKFSYKIVREYKNLRLVLLDFEKI